MMLVNCFSSSAIILPVFLFSFLTPSSSVPCPIIWRTDGSIKENVPEGEDALGDSSSKQKKEQKKSKNESDNSVARFW
jgi:hypothetical protein